MSRKIVIDIKSTVPIFQQIVNEVERQVLVGELKDGDFLTSVRDFAIANTVNPNTVARAYQQLQAMGLVEAVRGKGLVVKKLREKAASDRREAIITAKISDLLELSASLKISIDDLVDRIRSIGRKR